MNEAVHLRAVVEGDLPELFEHQRDPVANEMAAFPPRTRDAFMAHWRKILADSSVTTCTILVGTAIAGNIVCFEQSGKLLLGYWLGRRFWGRGIATEAVAAFVPRIPIRPLHAYVAKTNTGSIRVLDKCGFTLTGEHRTEATDGGETIEEFVYSLTE